MLNAITISAARNGATIAPSRRALTPANDNCPPEPPPAASLRLPLPLRPWLMAYGGRAAA